MLTLRRVKTPSANAMIDEHEDSSEFPDVVLVRRISDRFQSVSVTDYPTHAHKLIIRVVGYTLMGAFQPSPEISLLLAENERSTKKKQQAILSGEF